MGAVCWDWGRNPQTLKNSRPFQLPKNLRAGLLAKNSRQPDAPKNSRHGSPPKNSRTMNTSKNSQASPEPKNSRQPDAPKNSRTDSEPTRGNKTTSEHGTPEEPSTIGGQSIEDIVKRLNAVKRQRTRAIWRGVALLVVPPVVLCVPLIVLKALHLLLIPWGWCISPLLLWLFPTACVFRTFITAYKAYKAQTRQPKAFERPNGQRARK